MTSRNHRGFTLIELMVVVVIIGVLAAIAIPNFVAMQDRAKEGSTKTNMHTFQLSAEDYGIQNSGVYSSSAAAVASLIPPAGITFVNPFNKTAAAWVDAGSWGVPLSTGSSIAGIVAYKDSLKMRYQIAGRGKKTDLNIVLSSGQ